MGGFGIADTFWGDTIIGNNPATALAQSKLVRECKRLLSNESLRALAPNTGVLASLGFVFWNESKWCYSFR